MIVLMGGLPFGQVGRIERDLGVRFDYMVTGVPAGGLRIVEMRPCLVIIPAMANTSYAQQWRAADYDVGFYQPDTDNFRLKVQIANNREQEAAWQVSQRLRGIVHEDDQDGQTPSRRRLVEPPPEGEMDLSAL